MNLIRRPWPTIGNGGNRLAIGSIAAAVFLRTMFGTIGALGATTPGAGVGSGTALAMEVVLTAGLVNAILGTAAGARNVGANGAIAVGAMSRWQASGQRRSAAPR